MVEKKLRTQKFGTWIREKFNEYKWQQTTITYNDNGTENSEVIELKTPESQGLTRQFNGVCLFMREIPSLDDLEETTKLWYKQELNFSIRNDVTMNIWFRKTNDKLSRKLFILDVEPSQGFAAEVSYESTPTYTVKKSKPVRVEPSEATAIAKSDKCLGIFGKVEMEGSEVKSYGITV